MNFELTRDCAMSRWWWWPSSSTSSPRRHKTWKEQKEDKKKELRPWNHYEETTISNYVPKKQLLPTRTYHGVLTVFDYCWIMHANTEMNVGLSRYARWFLLLMLFIYAMLLWYSNDLQTHAVLDIEIRQYCIVGIILPKIPVGKWLHRTIFSFNSQ